MSTREEPRLAGTDKGHNPPGSNSRRDHPLVRTQPPIASHVGLPSLRAQGCAAPTPALALHSPAPPGSEGGGCHRTATSQSFHHRGEQRGDGTLTATTPPRHIPISSPSNKHAGPGVQAVYSRTAAGQGQTRPRGSPAGLPRGTGGKPGRSLSLREEAPPPHLQPRPGATPQIGRAHV